MATNTRGAGVPTGIDAASFEALLSFAERHGRCWKSLLRGYWERSEYPEEFVGDAALLQGLRNNRGPGWLFRITLGQLRYSVERYRRASRPEPTPAAPRFCPACGLPSDAPIHTGGHPTRCHAFASTRPEAGPTTKGGR